MSPSPAAIAAIQAYASALAGGWAANTDAAILTAANAPSVANPTPQATIGTPYTFTNLMGVLSSQSIGNVKALPYLPSIVDDVNNGNLAACARWLALFVATSVVTSDEATAIQGVMTATELDPSWPAQISWAQANLGRPLDAEDLTEARPT